VASRARVGLRRPDVAAALPGFAHSGQSGFRLETGALSRPGRDARLTAILEDGARVPLAVFRASPTTDAPRSQEPLVSVVVPCFNQAHYLGEALESCLAQSHPNVEILVVDDGSSDNTGEVTARFPEVQYLRQDNRGLSGARNSGLARCRGTYVTFLDADDRLLPTALETNLSLLLDHPNYAFVYGHYRLVTEDGSPLAQDPSPPPGPRSYRELLQKNFIGMPATATYRSDVFALVDGFDETNSPCADWELSLRISRRFPIAGHPDVVAEYRKHGANMSRGSRAMLESALAVLRSQRPFARRDPALRKALARGEEWARKLYPPDRENGRRSLRDRFRRPARASRTRS
jgi:glycosyltransferase involved in cell wall biosynthesis